MGDGRRALVVSGPGDQDHSRGRDLRPWCAGRLFDRREDDGGATRIVAAALGAAAVLGAISLLGASSAGASSNGQPAFYTYQAPGGAATAGQRVVALTFDDGPGPFTPQMLSVLERYQVPATFFEIGEEVARYPQYSRMAAAAGYPGREPHLEPSRPVHAPRLERGLPDRHDAGRDPQRDGHHAAVRAPALRRVERHRAERDRIAWAGDDELLRRPEGLHAARVPRPSRTEWSAQHSPAPSSACTTAEATGPRRWRRSRRSSRGCGQWATGSSPCAAEVVPQDPR